MAIDFSIVIPAKNEQENIEGLLKNIRSAFPSAELIIVNDGSTDKTKIIAEEFADTVITHPYSLGNGSAIKSGARKATHNVIVFMDADGQHMPDTIQSLLDKIEEGYDMAVGARTISSQANIFRSIGNNIYNFIASKVTGHKIKDLTSGFRAVKKDLFNRFLYLLPNGFSYPTTITMAFFRSGYSVAYIPFEAKKRSGKSHLNIFTDGLRFFVIIIKIASLYAPLKVFTPVAMITFILGLSNYAYTYFSDGRFTNMSALLLIVSIVIFMLGLLAEQITVLTYAASESRSSDKIHN